MLYVYFGGLMVWRFSMLSTFFWNNSFIRLKITKYFLGTQGSTYMCNEMITEWDVLLFFGSLGSDSARRLPRQHNWRGVAFVGAHW